MTQPYFTGGRPFSELRERCVEPTIFPVRTGGIQPTRSLIGNPYIILYQLIYWDPRVYRPQMRETSKETTVSEQPQVTGSGKRRGSLSYRASSWVRESILSRQLAAGSVVRPEDVGQELGISQTPAREALQTLKAEGFLVTRPGVGFVVAPLTPKDIRDIFTAHALLAGEITARAVYNITEDEAGELEAIHFELLAASKRRDSARVEDRNHAFHRHITHLADAPKLAHVLGMVSRYIPRTFYSSVGGWVDASAHDHNDILTAFRERDQDKAREAMSKHMINAGELLAQSFADGEPAADGTGGMSTAADESSGNSARSSTWNR